MSGSPLIKNWILTSAFSMGSPEEFSTRPEMLPDMSFVAATVESGFWLFASPLSDATPLSINPIKIQSPTINRIKGLPTTLLFRVIVIFSAGVCRICSIICTRNSPFSSEFFVTCRGVWTIPIQVLLKTTEHTDRLKFTFNGEITGRDGLSGDVHWLI